MGTQVLTLRSRADTRSTPPAAKKIRLGASAGPLTEIASLEPTGAVRLITLRTGSAAQRVRERARANATFVVEPDWYEDLAKLLARVQLPVRTQASALLRTPAWLLGATRLETPLAWITDDGALKLEWNRPDRSLAVFFEVVPRDSGWCFTSLPSAGGAAEWGTLLDLKPERLFEKLRR